MNPLIMVLLTTYRRTELALRTIQGVKQHCSYDNLAWHIADDGSTDMHLAALMEELQAEREQGKVTLTNAMRRGAGRSMNLGMERARELGAEFILFLEDDWEIRDPLDLGLLVRLMQEQPDIGMVRLGYISPGIKGELISGAGRLWWKLEKGPTYTFCGHASLRSKAFWQAYGDYQEGLPPGETELYMCGTFNNTAGPGIVVPAWSGEWGLFAHIGSESYKDVRPE